jgi:hypothetical protein
VKVFLAGIMQGSLKELAIHSQDWRDRIREIFARRRGAAEVYCHFENHPDSVSYDLPEIVETLETGNRLAAESDVVVCWLPEASMGTAVEMLSAARGRAVVLTVTPMSANWVVRAYSDVVLADLDALDDFLAGDELERLLERKQRERGSGD